MRFAFLRRTNTVEIAVIVKFQLDWNLDSAFELPELSHHVIKHHYLRETESLVQRLRLNGQGQRA